MQSLRPSVAITDASGRTLSGQTVDAFLHSVEHVDPLSIGVNCSLGATEMRPYVADLAQRAGCFVTSYPNAGLPNAFGGYDEQPETTAALLREFAESGLVNAVGGCCGTTPAHIAAIDAAIRGVSPREPAMRRSACCVRSTRSSPCRSCSRRWAWPCRPCTPSHGNGRGSRSTARCSAKT